MSSRTDLPAGWGFALVGTIAVAAVLRFVGLQNGLWYDEIVTLVQSARLPVARIVTEFPGVNVHPLYSLVAHASMSVFGESAWALRLPASLFGVGSIVLVYVLGARLTTRVEAWAAAAFLATSYHHIWFSQNARGYTLMAFLALVSTDALLRIAHSGRRRDYVVYVLACAAGVYAHLTMAFVAAGHAAVVLIGRVLRWPAAGVQPLGPAMWAWVAAGVLSILLYLPYMSNLIPIMVGPDVPREAAQVATASWALGEAVRSLLSGAGVPAALAGVALAGVGAMSLWRRQPYATALLVAPGLVTLALIVGLGQPLRPRFFFFLSGAGAIFVGAGIGAALRVVAPKLARRPSGLSVATVICTLALVAASLPALARNYELPKQDFEGTVQYLDGVEAEGSAVATVGLACLPLNDYYERPWPCLAGMEDLAALAEPGRPAVVAYTLVDYVEDPELRSALRSSCRIVRRFPGTLGGGDVFVCEVQP